MATNRSQFLILATLFEGGIAIVAFALAWLIEINPFDHFDTSVTAIGLGLGGTLPMLAAFAVTYCYPVGGLKGIKQFLIETIGPPLAECRWYDVVWVALLAGFSEELLFRSVFQVWFLRWSAVTAISLLLSNLLFGLAHCITALYAVLAAVLGIYLGTLFHVADHNLLVPALTHALYDLIAFVVIRRSYAAAEMAKIDQSPP